MTLCALESSNSAGMDKRVLMHRKALLKSVRILKLSLISVVLSQAEAAYIFLNAAFTTLDEARRERDVRTAENVIKAIDDILITLEANREQRIAIKTARNALAARLNDLRRTLTAEK